MKRLTNHVTRRIDAFVSGDDKTPQLPILDRVHLEQLEALYPPRCLGRMETADEHLRYAGMVELIANLRQRFDQATASPEDGGEEPDPLLDGELAQSQ